MGEVDDQVFQGISLPTYHFSLFGDDSDQCDSRSVSSSDDSITSVVSSSSDLTEDATSSTPSSSSHLVSDGPLYELSELMAQLPIKRGLSKYFQGKSQSFTSLSNVRCIDDLAKRKSYPTPYKKKMKACKSYGGGFDSHKSYVPGTCNRAISKKASRLAYSPSFLKRSRLPVQNNS